MRRKKNQKCKGALFYTEHNLGVLQEKFLTRYFFKLSLKYTKIVFRAKKCSALHGSFWELKIFLVHNITNTEHSNKPQVISGNDLVLTNSGQKRVISFSANCIIDFKSWKCKNFLSKPMKRFCLWQRITIFGFVLSFWLACPSCSSLLDLVTVWGFTSLRRAFNEKVLK